MEIEGDYIEIRFNCYFIQCTFDAGLIVLSLQAGTT